MSAVLTILPPPAVPVLADQPIVVNELVMDDGSRFGHYSLGHIRISTTNRKRFSLPALTELAESIKAMGVAQPILIRPVTPTAEAPQLYEIVAGERRFRASILAGCVSIPAMCRPLTDLEAAKIQILENLQREDPHPLEEAEGYERLMLSHGYTVDLLVDELKKSRSYVYGRLKLCSLTINVRELFLDNQLSAEVALLIARIPPALQATAAAEVIKPKHWPHEPFSVRQAKEHIQRHYTLNLNQASFPIKDASLVADAGSCVTCPKRAGNQPDFTGDKKSADVCTDPTCFAEKRAAHAEKERKEAKAKGLQVVTGDAAKKIMPSTWAEMKGGYVDVDKHIHVAGKSTTYRKLLGKNLPAIALLENPHAAGMIPIAKIADIEAALAAAGQPIPETDRSRNAAQKAREKEHEAKAKIEREYRRRLFVAVREKATPELTAVDVRAAAFLLFRNCHNDVQPFIGRLHGWEPEAYQSGHDGGKWTDGSVKMRRLIDALDVEQAAMLIRDITWASNLQFSTYNGSDSKPEGLLLVASQFHVDAKKIHTDVKRDAEAKEAAKKKPAAKSKPTKAALPAQMEIQTAPETNMASALDASLAAAMAGEILPMREFIEASPDRINELATAVIAQRPDLVGQLKYIAGEMDFAYSDGAFKRAEKSDETDEESPPPAPRPKLQVKAKPPAPTPSGPIIKKKKNRAIAVPPNGDLPAGMEFPQ